jgi:hypothetical protein
MLALFFYILLASALNYGREDGLSPLYALIVTNLNPISPFSYTVPSSVAPKTC